MDSHVPTSSDESRFSSSSRLHMAERCRVCGFGWLETSHGVGGDLELKRSDEYRGDQAVIVPDRFPRSSDPKLGTKTGWHDICGWL